MGYLSKFAATYHDVWHWQSRERGIVKNCCVEESIMAELGDYIEILNEDFQTTQSVPGEGPTIWRLSHRWNDLIFNSPLSFHSHAGLGPGINPFQLRDGRLVVTPQRIAPELRAQVHEMLIEQGAKPEAVPAVDYATGLISLHDSWSQTFGYFEIRAKMPEGRGHWPALWLAPATKGWPPEIDIIEVDGAKHGWLYNNKWVATAHFDGIDPKGAPIAVPRDAHERPNGAASRYFWTKEIDADDYGINISDDFAIYALEWTAEEIVWRFGATADTLEEVFRTPTPPDLTSPLYFIANTEVGGVMGGDPGVRGLSDAALEIDYIKILARRPDRILQGSGVITGTRTSEDITGSDMADDITPGGGLDRLTLGGGPDLVRISRGTGNKIITDFTTQDRLILEGFSYPDGRALLDAARQVGSDVWLRQPGKPFEPQTIILKGTSLTELSVEQFELK